MVAAFPLVLVFRRFPDSVTDMCVHIEFKAILMRATLASRLLAIVIMPFILLEQHKGMIIIPCSVFLCTRKCKQFAWLG